MDKQSELSSLLQSKLGIHNLLEMTCLLTFKLKYIRRKALLYLIRALS